MNDLQNFATLFDDITPWSGRIPDGFAVDFLGTRTRTSFVELGQGVRQEIGSVVPVNGESHLEVPRPTLAGKEKNGEFWFEAADWVLAARDARRRFVMMSLGALYGYQAVGSYRTLQRLNPMPCTLVAVEPIPENMDLVRLHMRDNDIDPDDHWLLQTAVAATNEPVFFPVGSPGLGAQNCIATNEQDARRDYLETFLTEGREEEALTNLLLHKTTGLQKEIIEGKDHFAEIKLVSATTLGDLLRPFERIDFLEADIQQSEIVVFPPFRSLLKRKVHRIHLGTHGGDVHQSLLQMFIVDGWEVIFNYKPGSIHQTVLGAFSTNDGILSVLNPDV